MAFLLKPMTFPEKIFLAFLLFLATLWSTELKSLIFESKLHLFAIKTVISSNFPKRIRVDKEWLDSEQSGNSEPFPNLPIYPINSEYLALLNNLSDQNVPLSPSLTVYHFSLGFIGEN